MSWALGAVVVVLAIAMAFLARRLVKLQSQLDSARNEILQEGTVAAATRATNDQLVTELERALEHAAAAEQHASEADALGAGGGSDQAEGAGPGDDRLTALWNLTAFELARAWPLEDLPVTHEPSLVAALTTEVGRIREETGTPGTLRAELDPPPTAPVCEATWRTSKALLGVLVRHTQAFDVLIDRRASDLVTTVVCEGWEGPESVADDISELYGVVAPIGIHLEVDQDDEGRVRATLRIPETS